MDILTKEGTDTENCRINAYLLAASQVNCLLHSTTYYCAY